MISSLCWIPKGVAKAEPVQAELTEEELAALRAADGDAGDEGEDEEPSDSEPSDSEMDDSDEELDEEAQVAKAKAMAAALKSSGGGGGGSGGAAAPGSDSLAAAMAELDMDHYDDSDDESGAVTRILGGGNPGMAFHRNPQDDPYLKHNEDSEDSGDEAEDLRLRDTDLLILAARNEDDVSYLEMWVYEEPDERGEGNLYVHHTTLLSAFPLCVAWMDCDPRGKAERGNFAAVGSFEPGIEIWDMDVLDAVEPVATLGGFADPEAAAAAAEAAAEYMAASGSSDGKKKKKKKKAKAPAMPPVLPGSHSDAVLGLSWNAEYRNVLASGSADQTVKVWDVATQQCRHTLSHHSGKVQAVSWNPAEASVLLTGAFDKQACLVDVRAPEGEALRWQVSSDVEALAWAPHAPTNFLVSSEDGIVACFDARQGPGSAPLWRLAAHDKATCAVSFCASVPGLLMTASTDKKVKLWNVAGSAPAQLAAEDLKVGAVFSAGFCRDSPLLVAAGGSKGTVSVWDTKTATAPAVTAFVQQQQQQQQPGGQ